jgi:hypothetical protein
MVWQTDKRRLQGGYMRCVFKHVSFRLDHPEYRDRERLRGRERLIRELDDKIDALIEAHPFLREFA